MTLKNWIQTNNQFYLPYKNQFPVYFNFIEKRYDQFELKYPVENFNLLFESFILENYKELQKIENVKNLTFSQDNLGEVVKEVDNNNSNFSGESSVNYVGLNVEGTFNKNSTTSETTAKNNKQINKINLVNEIVKLNNVSLIKQFSYLNTEFEKLLIIYIPFK